MHVQPFLRQEPAPMSPALPECWTVDVHEAAKAHTGEAFPDEAVGIVEGGVYVPLFNRSTTPDQDVMLTDEDLMRAAQAQAFFHSHPGALGCPSETDMVYQQQLGIPFLVMCWPTYDFFWWGDMLARAPLIGRGFRHGVHDCCSLIRDWYGERGIIFHDGPRNWAWWEHGGNLYLENFERAGFQKIAPANASQVGDVLLMAFNNPVPMHGAVVIESGLILHHPAGSRAVDPTRLSTAVPRGRYDKHVTLALRRA